MSEEVQERIILRLSRKEIEDFIKDIQYAHHALYNVTPSATLPIALESLKSAHFCTLHALDKIFQKMQEAVKEAELKRNSLDELL